MPTRANSSGQQQLRKGRVSIGGQAYILTTVTHQRRAIFQNLGAARKVVNALRYQEEAGRVHSLAYVLMPDHLHWLVVLKGSSDLSNAIRSVKSYSGRRLKTLFQEEDSEDPIWQTGFHDRAVRRDEDLLQAARYIVANPLRAGLVEQIGNYPHWDAVWLGEGDGPDWILG
ncbi:MAG: REP-associated tyrosine transposase [Thiohalorhabdus sp.]|uniref:REP-associated tyrosine transposase n=1 Tax=Thiohalorhabdus sp. TaxID=3094134 RepID=UPI003980307C